MTAALTRPGPSAGTSGSGHDGRAGYREYGDQFAAFYDAVFPREAIGTDELAWLRQVLPGRTRRLAELGVGTGRVALPLAGSLLRDEDGPVEYLGVDVSAAMLGELGSHDPRGLVSPLLADITDVTLPTGLDAVLCVCGTLSMITEPRGQAAAVAAAAAALRPGGVLVVETHHADAVLALHPTADRSWAVAYPGDRRMLATFSHLDGRRWDLEHCWLDAGTATFARESSRVTSLDEVDAYATAAGLVPAGRSAGLRGAPLTPASPTATAVYRRPGPPPPEPDQEG
ncbi:bifunctional 2-polyprenyl-6-hydroxyphenol methylase/3-demethylubiquinol 3-O-methyltransferase UbiG [Cellulomonas sp. C5510]|uniref:class I SAM-dependent methyltransferase n=1 Tax=Cellulomonas sp. C5510 TaxID=2871170 RepID=UPI001C952C96|nr:class I SAM-dependent methyltransferase [Cellulomonas sp. C5510]QZN84680.1 class I SAM-dependent methyltransferase [Cellulomonas sp. C5510]